jgi:hypothetical protein
MQKKSELTADLHQSATCGNTFGLYGNLMKVIVSQETYLTLQDDKQAIQPELTQELLLR